MIRLDLISRDFKYRCFKTSLRHLPGNSRGKESEGEQMTGMAGALWPVRSGRHPCISRAETSAGGLCLLGVCREEP